MKKIPISPRPPIQCVNLCSSQVVNSTGNQDICYYNFLCAHPLGALRCASRHVFFFLHAVCVIIIIIITCLRKVMINSPHTVHSTTSSVTSVTWCWGSSFSSSSSKEISPTTALWNAATSTRWWGTCTLKMCFPKICIYTQRSDCILMTVVHATFGLF